MTSREAIEACLDALGGPWPWDAGLSRLLDEAVVEEEGVDEEWDDEAAA